jgi:GNAT superfamily N-acetyltransferase
VAITSFLADAEVEYGSYFDNDQNKRIKTAELLSIQVTENTQKTGLGSVLLQYTLAVAKKRGIDFMHLNAKPFNIPTDKSYNNALADLEVFYENNGGVVTNYHEDTTDFSFNVS